MIGSVRGGCLNIGIIAERGRLRRLRLGEILFNHVMDTYPDEFSVEQLIDIDFERYEFRNLQSLNVEDPHDVSEEFLVVVD